MMARSCSTSRAMDILPLATVHQQDVRHLAPPLDTAKAPVKALTHRAIVIRPSSDAFDIGNVGKVALPGGPSGRTTTQDATVALATGMN